MKLKVFFLIVLIAASTLLIKANPHLLRMSPVKQASVTPDLFVQPTSLWGEVTLPQDAQAIFYRGDLQRQGHVTHFSQGSFKKEWEKIGFNVGVHTASKASPVADDSGVYVGTDTSWFFAFKPDGSLKWKFFGSDSGRGFHSTAVIVGDYVFVGSYSGMVYCFQKNTGQLMWSKKVGETLGASPVFYKGDLITAVETARPVNGFVVRLSARDGQIKWVSPFLGEQSHSSPVISESNRLVLLGANNWMFFGLDLETGKVRWSVKTNGEVKSTPLVLGDRVFFSDWGARLHCLEVQSGKEVWMKNLTFASQVSASYAPKAGLIIIGDSLGYVYGINPETGTPKWHVKFTMTKLLSSPVVVLSPEEDFLISCSDTEACWMRAGDGKLLSKISLGHRLSGVPFIRENEIYFSLNEGPLQKWSRQ